MFAEEASAAPPLSPVKITIGLRPLVALFVLLSLSTAVALGAVAVRILYTGSAAYWSLVWNLFLAWIPLAIAMPLSRFNPRGRREWLAALGLGVLWLLFLPNSPYLLTDFIHLAPGRAFRDAQVGMLAGMRPAGAPMPEVPVWYDVIVLFTFAWNGMMLGLVSLHLMRKALTRWLGTGAAWTITAACVLLCAFGVSLGRFERFNSWDVFTRPWRVAPQILDRVIHPLDYPRTTVATLMLAPFLLLAYLSIVALLRLEVADSAREEQNPTGRAADDQDARAVTVAA